MPKHHRFDDRGSNNYQLLPKHARSPQTRAAIVHIATNNQASCYLPQEPVQ